ncbi:hypothetical protein CDD80_989 [Ophiocordyceps camponoti-rufipedis]|uniref:RING-type domain-containing protein n=1 Tax=Ophiocordyceps camponoti-rufipedis TaxID=2004952 RepID=A0A2C5XKM7_9HYPO|nr:hypothetical protein CDD80_989 [Ophiocordyceps camponoti-rufipedis]
MVFSGLLSPSSDKASTASRSRSGSDGLIYDEAQLPCVPPERPNLRDLNNSLEALAAVFPDVQTDVFRELLTKFDGESRLALVAEALLKNRVAWVKGRWRTVTEDGGGGVCKADSFRSPEYAQAVRALAWHEFRGLSRSTMNAVLAESNHSYLEARRTLVALSSQSWRFTISSMLRRRKPMATGEAERHPLVVWRAIGGEGVVMPAIRPTGSAELDRELFDALVRPLQTRERKARDAADRRLALGMNRDEAERVGAVHECACCFSTAVFEQFTCCNEAGHMMCFRCVLHATKEALFGQSWLSSFRMDTGTLRCLAVEGDGCSGYIPADQLRRALTADDDDDDDDDDEDEHTPGADMVRRLDERLAEHNLATSRLALTRCPFCSYSEVDEATLTGARPRFTTGAMAVLAVVAALLLLSLPVALVSALACAVMGSERSAWRMLRQSWQRAMHRVQRRRRGLRFRCQSPRCGRQSCLSCHKPWTDVHICHESSLLALRTQVETAMSMAIKRVCPRCDTSFVKNSGCNKLTCPCGYKIGGCGPGLSRVSPL